MHTTDIMLYIFLESEESVDLNFYEKRIEFNKIFHSKFAFFFLFANLEKLGKSNKMGACVGWRSVRLFLAPEVIFSLYSFMQTFVSLSNNQVKEILRTIKEYYSFVPK